jgi:hypothetical protein
MPRPKKKGVVGIKLRIATELLSELEAAAKKHKISFNAEAVRRLGESFGEERAFGGEVGRRWLHFLANAFVFAGERYYRDHIRPKQKTDKVDEGPNVALWIEEPEAYQAAMMDVIEEVMLRRQPGATYEKCIAQHDALRGIIFNHFRGQAGWVKPELNKEGGK